MKNAKLYAVLTAMILGLTIACSAQSQVPQSRPIPAATFSEFHCSGFISASPISTAIRVFNGADNDMYEPLHQFTGGDLVYLRRSDPTRFVVGQAYSLVRPENGFYGLTLWPSGMLENQILPPASRYVLQRWHITSLGRPYNNTGLVRVVKVTAQGAIARVVFTCNGINPGDIAVPYVPEPIPQYVPATHLARFAPPNGKLEGVIVGASASGDYLAEGSMAFLNVGQRNGVTAGQRFRIFAIFRFSLPQDLQGSKPQGATPRETVGELIILHVHRKSSVGIVVKSLREIEIGDGVELE
jgi:hypothetical protein